jgi:alpha-tubulin suppressor-like RCC1 family protein
MDSMVRKALFMTLLLALLCTVGLGLLKAPTLVGPHTSKTPAFCPRFGKNPPKALPLPGRATSVEFLGSGVLIVDEAGNVWTYARTDTQCDDPAPVRLVDAAVFAKAFPDAGKIVQVTGRAVLTEHGRTFLANSWSVPLSCSTGPRPCPGLESVDVSEAASLAEGDQHVLFVGTDGLLWSQGLNDCGQLARPTTQTNTPYAKRVPDFRPVASVAAGMRSSMALDKNGQVWTWGNLSHPNFDSTWGTQPVPGWSYCPFPDHDDEAQHLSGKADGTPRKVEGLPAITQVSANYASDFALDVHGVVWGWGYNSCGQLGVPPQLSPVLMTYSEKPLRIQGLPPIRQIAAGRRHVLALDAEGQVWAWGENQDTEIGPRFPALNGLQAACTAEGSGGEYAGYTPWPRQVPGIGHITRIAAGHNSSAAIDDQGKVWVWGRH